MLDMRRDIQQIFADRPKAKQVMMLNAIMTLETRSLCMSLMWERSCGNGANQDDGGTPHCIIVSLARLPKKVGGVNCAYAGANIAFAWRRV